MFTPDNRYPLTISTPPDVLVEQPNYMLLDPKGKVGIASLTILFWVYLVNLCLICGRYGFHSRCKGAFRIFTCRSVNFLKNR